MLSKEEIGKLRTWAEYWSGVAPSTERTMFKSVLALIDRNEALEAGLLRARIWGIASRAFDGSVSIELAEWVDGGCDGPPPELPDYLKVFSRKHAAALPSKED